MRQGGKQKWGWLSVYDAKIINQRGHTIELSFKNGIAFDISPISGVDVDISTSQSFLQVGESIEGTSVSGISREIYGVIFKNEKKYFDEISKVLSAFSKGTLYIGDYFCEFVVNKAPYFVREKSGRLVFNAVIYSAYPFWQLKKSAEYIIGGVDPAFSFPTRYDSHIFGIRKPVDVKNLYNSGNVKQGMHIEFSTIASVENFGLRNTKTNEFVQINETINADDKVTVYHQDGKLRIELTRDGENTNIINKLVEGSTLFELEMGDNVILPYAELGVENLNVYVKFNPAFTGVFV